MSDNFGQAAFYEFIHDIKVVIEMNHHNFLSIIKFQNEKINFLKDLKLDINLSVIKKNDDQVSKIFQLLIFKFDELLSILNSITDNDFYLISNINLNESKILDKFNSNELKSLEKNKILISDLTKEIENVIKRIPSHPEDIEPSYTIRSFTELSLKKGNLITILKNSHEHITKYIEDYSEIFLGPNQLKTNKKELDLLFKKFKNETDSLYEDIDNKFKNLTLDIEKISKNNNIINENTNRISSEIKNFDEKINNYELQLTNILNEKKENFDHEFNKIKLDTGNEIKLFKKSVNDMVDGISKSHTDFINLVQDAGIYKLTENYDNKAKEEKSQYETYRTYTSRAIGAAIGFTILILTIPLIEYWGANPPVNTNYYTILARLTISLMFFVLALYFSKQASKHYECYQDNHRTFLQLAALEPFMARMTPEEQKEIRKSLVPSYFNQTSDGKFIAKGDEVDMSVMFTFMDKLSNFNQSKKDPKVTDNTTVETKP